MPKYQLLALDLDGTLLGPDSRISEENVRALRQAQRAGVQLALCTGRNSADVRRLSAGLLAPPDWVVAANGAEVRPFAGGEAIYEAPLGRARCETILETCARFGCDPSLYTAERHYYGRAFGEFLASLQARGQSIDDGLCDPALFVSGPHRWRELLETERKPFLKAILYHADPRAVERMQQALAETGLFELAPSVLYGGALRNVEVNRKGVHKGAGLSALAAHLGIGLDAVMAVGDSGNDLTMLRAAGLGVAMANADAHIRAAADAVTADNAQHGVARAVEQYLLRA